MFTARIARMVLCAVCAVCAVCAGAVSACSTPADNPAVSSTGASIAGTKSPAEPAKVRIEIKEFAALPHRQNGYAPIALAAGPDGAIWVIDESQQAQKTAIVRVDPSGKRTQMFMYSAGGYSPLFGITTGPDGALWMTDYDNQLIVRMTTSGQMTSYRGADPVAITAGPDGALWTTMGPCCYFIGGIARLSTAGELTIYDQNLPRDTTTPAITSGPDGALWFIELGVNGIGRITTSGVITNFSKGLTGGATSIAPGPDGALWFTEPGAGRIGRITTDGHIREFSRGITQFEGPRGIAAGPDGAMWFTECELNCGPLSNAKVGRITMNGRITEYSNLTPTSEPSSIVQGPDHNMWFLEKNTNRLARIRILSE